MADPNTPALTQIKLAEMRRQRSRLAEQYSRIERDAAEAADPTERLRRLYNGLREVKFAQKPLHPDVDNLDLLFFEAEVYRPAPQIVRDRTRQLEIELARGRLRAEYAYIFSLLLNEWQPEAETTPPREDLFPARPDWTFLWNEAPAPHNPDFLNAFFARHPRFFEKPRAVLQEFLTDEALKPVTSEEVKGLLGLILGNIYRQAEMRSLAATIRNSSTQVAEYASTLTILLNNLADWDWPEEGVALRALWSRYRWRPYLDEDLLTFLLLQLIGLRWGMALKNLAQEHIYGWKQLQTLLATEETTHQADDEADFEEEDSFEDEADFEEDDAEEDESEGYYGINNARTRLYRQLFLPNMPESLYELESSDGYSSFQEESASLETPSPLELLLTSLNAEIRYHQARFPGQPLYMVQTDLRDFFLRIPHPVLETLLERLGVPEYWLAFFRKFFRARIRVEGETITCRQGIVLDHLLSVGLADYLLMLLDLYVFETTQVQLLRVTDDIYFVTDSAERARRAWQAIGEFCTACGLEVNLSKSGSVCIGGETPEDLPQGAPTWGLLQLQADAAWEIDEDAFMQIQEIIRRLAEANPTVLGMTAQVNAYLPFLHRNLGLAVNLGESHLERVGRRLGAFQGGLFGNGRGVVEEVVRRLTVRYPEARLSTGELPEALLYWPITAGGLGLANPLVPVMAFQKSRNAQPALQSPRDERRSGRTDRFAWYRYYSALSGTLDMETPASTPGMEALVEDFIARSNEVSGGDLKVLSPYWQWIVYTYGPSVLETFGTFRFLLTELVPIQLILENRLEATSL